MKRIFLSLIAMLAVATTFAQAPQGFTYQAAVRNNDGTAVANQQVNVRISLVQDSALGVERYTELHTPTTDAAGLFTIVVGQGTGLVNCMMADCIDWANGPWFLKTQIDPDGGQNFSLSTTQQLMSVPYALFAANVAHDTVHIRDSVVVHIHDRIIIRDSVEIHYDTTAFAADDDYHITLKLSHVFAPTEQLTVEMEQVAARILERTNGAVEIQTYGSSQLAVYKDNLQQVVDGSNWIACEDPSYLADYNINFEALIAPMLYANLQEYSYVCQSDLVKALCQDIEDNYGIHVLALDFNVGLRCMQTNKVITTPDDLKGMKIRVPNSSMYINLMNAMGATPVPMPFGETISAVQQGVVDGLEGNMNAYSTNGSAEVAKQMSFTNHLIGTCGAYINIDVWNSLPEEYRNIIQEEFTAGAAELTKFTDDNFQSTMEMLEKEQGCHFNDVDMDAFRAVMQVEYDRLVAEDGVDPDFIPKLQALVAEYDAANAA